nr:pre-mRNA-splicing factor CWC22 homolog [Aedes albopictus]
MGKSKANVQLVYLMGTTMLVLCLVPIIDGLLDRRYCNADGLCNDNEDESRFYSDKRVDRLDQDQEQRLLLFNRAERRDAERFDRRDRERIDERRSDRRDERLARQDRSDATNDRRDNDRLESRQERIYDRRDINGRSEENRVNGERMSERLDSHSEERRLTVEERRSGNDDRRERQERGDERRERQERGDERRERQERSDERRERQERFDERRFRDTRARTER